MQKHARIVSIEKERLFDALFEVVCVIDPEGVFRYINKAAQLVLGYEPEEMIGKVCYDFMPHADAAASRIAVLENRAGHHGGAFVNRYVHRNGSIVYIEWNGNYIKDGDIFFSIGKDVTEQHRLAQENKRFEQKIRHTNQQMKTLLDLSSDAIIQVDTDFTIVYGNRHLGQLSGKPSAEYLGTSLWDCPLVANHPEVEARLRDCREQQRPLVFEYYFNTISTLTRISLHPSPKGMSIFIKDISLHKASDADLTNLNVIQHCSNNAIILTDDQQRIVWVNNGFEKITGYTAQEVVGKIPGQLLNGPETDAELAREMREKLQRAEPVEAFIQCYRRNGETYWSEVVIQPIFNREGKLLHFLSIETDRTAQKQLEDKLEEYKQSMWAEVEEAVAIAQEKERHELAQELHDNVNQVLTTIKLYMEMVLHDKLDKKDILPRAMQNVQICIDELRSISKRLSTPLPKQTTSLGTQLSELAESVNLTEKINLSYSVEKFAFEPMPAALHNALWKTIQEQVNNILKYARADLAHVRLWKQNQCIHLLVKDNGAGFDAKMKRDGIGLQNMRQRVKELEGTFLLQTAPGQGCSIELQIPVD